MLHSPHGDARLTMLAITIEQLAPGRELLFKQSTQERAVIVLAGRCSLDWPDSDFKVESLGHRSDVFDGPASAAYVPRSQRCRLSSLRESVRIAIVSAPARSDHPAYVVTPDQITTERRGRDSWARTVHEIIGPRQPADRLLIGETYSDGGVWSGYPPHRHDRNDPSHENCFEEIFYVQVAPTDGFGILLNYDESVTRDSAVVVRNGDVVAVTKGYHSFVAAAEHRFYYLWALAGDSRALMVNVDPRYRWIAHRSTR